MAKLSGDEPTARFTALGEGAAFHALKDWARNGTTVKAAAMVFMLT
jgi:hypothetical protein